MKSRSIGQVCDRGVIGRRQEKTIKRATDAQIWENNPIIPFWDHKQNKWVIPE